MPADLQYVLELVNMARACGGMERLSDLPKGPAGDCDTCPIARAMPGDKVMVTMAEVIWETFPGDSMPERIAGVWAEECTVLDDRAEHLCEYVVGLPREIAVWIDEFDAITSSPWKRYRSND